MGKYNSSTYHVQPVFDALRAQDKTGRSGLAPLLELPRRTGRQPLALSPDQAGEIQEAAWSPAERALPAPRGLLLTSRCTRRSRSQSERGNPGTPRAGARLA